MAIHFKGCIGLRCHVKISDSEVIGEDAYDWSQVRDPRIKTSHELTAWLEAFADDWSLTGICPNPKFYRVERSSWADSFRYNHKHYIVKGTDSYVELLANEFEYRIEKDIIE